MLSKKVLNKVKDDMRRMKEILSEMQINVGTHNFKINKDMVDEQKLKIAMELMES